jgi:hypothetical protein
MSEISNFGARFQLKDARVISSGPERLISNWLAIEAKPNRIRFYDFKGSISHGAALGAIRNAPVPVTPFNRGFLSFAPLPELQDHFGSNLPLEVILESLTEEFLETGCSDPQILPRDAQARFVDLARQGLNAFFGGRGLRPFELASERLAWWPTVALATMSQKSFAWLDGPSGRRQLVGYSTKRRFYWHYGVNCWTRSTPFPHVRVAGSVIFTSDGESLIGDDARRLHRRRRSFCRSWRNDKWRDLLLAFWHWLSVGEPVVDVPLGETAALRLRLPPMTWDACFGVDTASDNQFASIEGDDEDEQDDEEIFEDDFVATDTDEEEQDPDEDT